ncbi:MAG TPA: hypothetical protein VM536_03380 [Chloroflexia bacterium]|nr:hypothetical protein [Chloroflexia bacterium]
MQRTDLERAISWGRAYNPAWDGEPDAYYAAGRVGWGRTRRLGKVALPPAFKAYLGVQHVDPRLPGWAALPEAEARFFVSWFDGGRCISLRTVPTMPAALDILWAAWGQYTAAHSA